MFPSRIASVLGGGVGLPNAYSLEFDGTNDYVDTSSPFESTFKDSFTISSWVKPTDGRPSAYEYIYGIYGASGGKNRITLISGANGELNIRFRANDAGSGDSGGDTAAIWADGESTWTHTVVVADSTISGNDGLVLYVNGVKTAISGSGDTSAITFSDFNTTHNFILGSASVSSGVGTSNTFAGKLDEVAIWNTALSAGDISALYQAKGTSDLNDDGNSANLKGWWRMGDGDTFPTITDNSTNSNDGTMTNMDAVDIVKDTP